MATTTDTSIIKNLPEIAFLLFFLIILKWIAGDKAVFYFLLILLAGILISRIDEIKGIFTGSTKILDDETSKWFDTIDPSTIQRGNLA